jgi:hypothetical protein
MTYSLRQGSPAHYNQATSHAVRQLGFSTTDFATDLCALALAASQAQLYLNQNQVPNITILSTNLVPSKPHKPLAPPRAIFLSGVLHDGDSNPLHLESPPNGAHLRSRSLASTTASALPAMPPQILPFPQHGSFLKGNVQTTRPLSVAG